MTDKSEKRHSLLREWVMGLSSLCGIIDSRGAKEKPIYRGVLFASLLGSHYDYGD